MTEFEFEFAAALRYLYIFCVFSDFISRSDWIVIEWGVNAGPMTLNRRLSRTGSFRFRVSMSCLPLTRLLSAGNATGRRSCDWV